MKKNILISIFCLLIVFINAQYLNTSYIIDTLDIDRWQEYKELVLEAIDQEPYVFLGTKEEIGEISESGWRERLKKNNCHIFFAFHGNVLVGTASLVIENHEKLRHVAQVVSVYVTPHYRARGIGTKLLQAVIEKAKTYLFIEILSLQVTPTQTAAIRLYQSLGFKKEGMLPKIIKINESYQDQLIMIKYMQE